jgi:glycosyltransferase involved in cell wall biosynthesis
MSQPKANAKAIVVNLSTSGSRLGGAAIAAEWLSRCMAPHFPVELWRMWDSDQTLTLDHLPIRQYTSRTRYGTALPKQAKFAFLDSEIPDRLQAEPPALVHLQNPLPALAFERIARQSARAGIKVVTSTHGFYEVFNPNYGLGRLREFVWQYLITKPLVKALPYLDAVLLSYPAEAELLQRYGVAPEKMHLVPNGVNPFFLEPATIAERNQVLEQFSIDPSQPLLLFIGSHTGNKGLDTVVKIASQLSSPASVVIGGKLLDPEEPMRWKQQFPPAKQVNLIFTDYLSLTQQRALYQLSTLLLFPSLADTLPLTILEAMASQLAVIAYDVGGITYQLADNAGRVIPAGDFDGFLATVEQLLGDDELRQAIALNGLNRQRQIFSWEIAAQKTIAVYEHLLR